MAGLILDPWQELVLEHSLGERQDGKWSAFEVGLVVSRQNGKGSILEARELAGLFLLGERLIIHSAHQFDTSLEAFRRLLFLIEEHPDFSKRIKRVSRSHGEEGIELTTGQRVRFRTRTKGGGRGFSGDCLILDEAMILPESAHGALLPTLSARPNPQVWYTGSAVDQNVHEHGMVLSRVRARGMKGDDPGLAYFEWSADGDLAEADKVADDPAAWADANPGLGIRITSEYVGNEQRSMDPRTFAVERLALGDWPDPNPDSKAEVDLEGWKALADERSEPRDPLVFVWDVQPDRSSASIGVAGRRDDGLFHVEVIERRAGTGWLVDRLVELQERHRPAAIACAKNSPAAAQIAALENAGVEIEALSSQDVAQACGAFVDAVANDELRHLGDPYLLAALRGAAKRSVGDAWAWSRRSSQVDISPLVACTLALWKAQSAAGSVYEARGLLVL